MSDIFMQLDDAHRAEVMNALRTAVVDNFPELYEKDALLLASIIQRAKIRNEREYYWSGIESMNWKGGRKALVSLTTCINWSKNSSRKLCQLKYFLTYCFWVTAAALAPKRIWRNVAVRIGDSRPLLEALYALPRVPFRFVRRFHSIQALPSPLATSFAPA